MCSWKLWALFGFFFSLPTLYSAYSILSDVWVHSCSCKYVGRLMRQYSVTDAINNNRKSALGGGSHGSWVGV